LDVFAKGTSGDLQHIWHENGWHSWESLGGTLTSGPGVASWAPGRLDVFYANSASALGHVWYDGAWHSHQQLGSETISGSPAAVSWSNGRIDVVARGTAAGNPLIHKWYQGTWGSWETLGGSMATSPAIASWGPGRLDIFYLDSAQTLRTQWFNGTWHAEAAITGETYSGQPSAVSWGGERIDVVVKSSATGAVQRTWTPSLTRDVLTQHNDNWRSGAALKETELTPSAVSSRMGLLYTLPVSGTIYAQPLYVEGVTIGGVSRNVVYVATLANEVYAFNADSTSTTPLWHTTLESARPNEGNLNLGDLTEPSGLLATPVIDRASNSLYLVDATGTGSSAIFYLHKLDLRTGLDVVSRVAVGGSTTRSKYTDPASGKVTTFDPTFQLQRVGLLLANGYVYVAFGSSMDRFGYYGWVFAHRADNLAQALVYNTTGVTKSGGGIWQSGNGLAADERGNVYFMTGNGVTADGKGLGSSPERQEDSFVKLEGTSLHVLGQHWPHDVANEFSNMEAYDIDLGSGGVMLVPGQNALVGGGKPGKLHVLDRSMGALQTAFQAFTNTWRADPPSTYLVNMNIAPNIHGSPVYWETADPDWSKVYAWSEKDSLKAFPFNRNTWTIDTAHVLSADVRSQVDSMPGGILSLSANGRVAGSAIVWAVVEEPINTCSLPAGQAANCGSVSTCDALCYSVPGRLYAFDATTLAQLYQASVPRYSKNTPPTIANGKVYVATSNNQVRVYGLLLP